MVGIFNQESVNQYVELVAEDGEVTMEKFSCILSFVLGLISEIPKKGNVSVQEKEKNCIIF